MVQLQCTQKGDHRCRKSKDEFMPLRPHIIIFIGYKHLKETGGY
jgi:hypothetical protein